MLAALHTRVAQACSDQTCLQILVLKAIELFLCLVNYRHAHLRGRGLLRSGAAALLALRLSEGPLGGARLLEHGRDCLFALKQCLDGGSAIKFLQLLL